MAKNKPVEQGQFFSRVYIERRPPLQDSKAFRTRIAAYLEQTHHDRARDFAAHLKRELGVAVPSFRGPGGISYEISDFLDSTDITTLLNTVTAVWRVLRVPYSNESEKWRQFVARALHEENLGYTIDDKGGMHYYVDEEFERNRVSALRSLDAPKHAAVRTAFELAHSYLEANPPDTKAAVRSMFESVEILGKLMDPDAERLNRKLIEKLKLLSTGTQTDAIEIKAREKMFDGFADWVDAIHNYRHGQATEDPIAPSIGFAVYTLATGAAMLRMLVDLD